MPPAGYMVSFRDTRETREQVKERGAITRKNCTKGKDEVGFYQVDVHNTKNRLKTLKTSTENISEVLSVVLKQKPVHKPLSEG